MVDTIFRQYDIRGKVESELLLADMYRLGQAIAFYMCENKPGIQTVALGMDGRLHSPIIKKEIQRALIDAGLDVLDIGLTASPVLYFTLHTQKVDAGLMITASHNPQEYNGIKMVLGKESIWGKEIAVIKRYYHEGKHMFPSRIGVIISKEMNERYVL